MRVVLLGAPRTKKNHSRIERRGKRNVILPSHAHEAWYASVFHSAKRQRPGAGPIRCPVNCAALFLRDRLIGDAVGYYQAVADLLQKAGIIENDALIVSWDGSRLGKDAANPRIELFLTPTEG